MTQQEIFDNSPSKFREGDTVKHKSTDDFTMVITHLSSNDFKDNSFLNNKEGIKNPEWLFCKYYNKHTNKWEEQKFHYLELTLVSVHSSKT